MSSVAWRFGVGAVQVLTFWLQAICPSTRRAKVLPPQVIHAYKHSFPSITFPFSEISKVDECLQAGGYWICYTLYCRKERKLEAFGAF
uniref:Secreted protein n=1 Tax=Xenopus tropicalis TaxID=8364 RepID=A0A1B8XV87_XENTR